MSERLEEIRARAGAATAGPWGATSTVDDAAGDLWPWTIYVDDAKDDTPMVVTGKEAYESSENDYGVHGAADAEFIAHAREDIPYLLLQIEVLQGALRAASEPHPGPTERDVYDAYREGGWR